MRILGIDPGYGIIGFGLVIMVISIALYLYHLASGGMQ